MPYSIDNPPDKIKDMPKHAQEIFISAFNNALKQYDGDEERANKVAYAAVKNEYKQDKDGNWIAKESEVTMKTKESMSDDDKRNLLQSALEMKFPSSDRVMPSGAWIVDIFDTEIVYRKDGIDYKASYVVDSEGNVTFGEPTKVKRQTTYVAIESLQNAYAEILQEVGRRNASLDLARIKKIRELCEELLNDDEPEEKKTKEALKEAKSVLKWLQEQKVMKTEDDVKFPAEAYAYVPDAEQSSGWRLRLWEDLEKKVTRKRLDIAAAALSPGGFKGQRVEIPKEALSAVKRKIRAAYRSLGVEDEDIPRWVKETESRHLLTNYTSLEEADIGSKGIAKVIVIKPGWGNPVDNHYYPSEVLARDCHVFEGIKMYADHQTEEEEKQRPEGSIREWVASLKNVHYEEGLGVVGDAVIIEPWLQQKLAVLRDKKLLSEMGISIRAAGVGTNGEAEGRKGNILDKITHARSVDFVTEAGAGGGVLLYETEREFDIDVITLNVLRERRPDLVKSIEGEVKETMLKEVKKAMEAEERIQELEGQVETLTTENTDLKTKNSEAEKAQRIAEAKSIIDEAIGKSELPDAAKERLVERFKDAESADGVEDAIKAEKEYLDKLAEGGKVKGLGPTDPDPQKSKEALKESFKAMYLSEGKSEEEAEKLAETAVNAR